MMALRTYVWWPLDRALISYEITIPPLRAGPCERPNVEAVIFPDQIDGPLLGVTAARIRWPAASVDPGRAFFAKRSGGNGARRFPKQEMVEHG
jgi:hypothetical protein